MGFKAREQIIESLIKDINSMSGDEWKKMWLMLGTTVPLSAVTGKAYRGGNRWMLLARQAKQGWPTARWMTKLQILKAGGRIVESEFRKDVMCEFWQRVSKRKKDEASSSDDKDHSSRMVVRPFWLYNVAQTEGLPEEMVNGPVKDLKPLEANCAEADRVIAATGARIEHGGDRACYSTLADLIRMPNPEQFLGETDDERLGHYYATKLHELGHWTGHESRLKRVYGVFGSPEYAREELVAEFASAIMCSELDIPMKDLQHPEYLANWLQIVKSDPAALLKGANAAEAAVAHIYSFSKVEKTEEEEEMQPLAKAA